MLHCGVWHLSAFIQGRIGAPHSKAIMAWRDAMGVLQRLELHVSRFYGLRCL